ncbi:MAG: DNA-processing protein DprA, partial [Clostridia bacterium]|nr:DNA-processing protein DprA [Clostridia bacterium]
MKDENSLYWIWLSEKCGIASKEFGRLADRYENPFDLYRLDEDEIEHLEGIDEGLKNRLCDKSLESAYAILRYCKQNRVDIVGYSDPRYPARLRSIEDPPVLLYVLGKMPDMNDRLCVGMVGTRKMSEYGRQTAYKISYELAAANAIVVSGMALGVDSVSACGALAAGPY